MKTRVQLLGVIFIAVLVALSAMGCSAAPQATYPTKPIEFVVHGGAGGGSDIFARTIVEMIQKQKLMPVTISVVNKSGGSSSVAKAYVAEHEGDPYYWMTASTTFQVSVLQGQTKLGYREFTPLAMLAQDSFVIIVKDDSPFKTMKDVIDSGKANPNKVRWAAGALGSDDYMIMMALNKVTGAQLTFVAFQEGELAAVLGGHVDVASANPQDVSAMVQAKRIRVLGVGGPARLPSLPQVQTLKEQGFDVSRTQWRGIFMPKGAPKEAVKYAEDTYKKLAATPEWKKYLADSDLLERFMGSEEFGKFLVEDFKEYDQVQSELGLKKASY